MPAFTRKLHNIKKSAPNLYDRYTIGHNCCGEWQVVVAQAWRGVPAMSIIHSGAQLEPFLRPS